MRRNPDYLERLSRADADEITAAIERFANENNGANLLNAQDLRGRTLAHYVAERGLTHKYKSSIQQVLFENNADFMIADNEGNTPVHVMALNAHERASSPMFQEYIKYAGRTNFDFTVLNNAGKSVLHIAALVEYVDTRAGMRLSATTYVRDILEAAKENGLAIELDVLTNTGSTTLYYLINHNRYDEALLLLEAGASPTKYGEGANDRDPVKQVDEQLSEIERRLRDEVLEEHQVAHGNRMVEKLQSIKAKMTASSKASLTSSAVKSTTSQDDIDKREGELRK